MKPVKNDSHFGITELCVHLDADLERYSLIGAHLEVA